MSPGSVLGIFSDPGGRGEGAFHLQVDADEDLVEELQNILLASAVRIEVNFDNACLFGYFFRACLQAQRAHQDPPCTQIEDAVGEPAGSALIYAPVRVSLALDQDDCLVAEPDPFGIHFPWRARFADEPSTLSRPSSSARLSSRNSATSS